MTYASDVHFSRSGSLAGHVADFFARLAKAQDERAVYNKTLRELKALSPRALADFGLNRSSIHSAAYAAAYGK